MSKAWNDTTNPKLQEMYWTNRFAATKGVKIASGNEREAILKFKFSNNFFGSFEKKRNF